MSTKRSVSSKTRNNWLIDTAVFLGALLAMLTGVYFLYLPSGGSAGGANPWVGTVILFARETWETLHTWGGLLMIGAVVVHLAIHWRWISMMTRRLFQKACGQACRFSRGAIVNLVVDGLIALSFVITAVSGLYFYFLPEGGYQGGRNPAWDPGFLFSRPVWDLLHTWAGITLTVMAVVHIAIHWGWIVKVTRKVFAARQLSPATS